MLFVSVAEADEITCSKPEQVGCVEIDFLVVSYDKDNWKLDDLVKGRVEPVDLGLPIYKDVKSGETSLYSECVSYTVFFWGVDTSVSTDRMAVYKDGSNTAEPKQVSRGEIPENARGIYPDIGEPAASYEVEVCGGKGAIQVPWAYIGPATYALICANGEGSLYPDSDGKKEGVWLSSKAWEFYRDEGYKWILVPLVMPAV